MNSSRRVSHKLWLMLCAYKTRKGKLTQAHGMMQRSREASRSLLPVDAEIHKVFSVANSNELDVNSPIIF